MPTELPVLTLRYPSGETEYRTSPTAPNVGDVLFSKGDSWIVEEVTTSTSDSTTLVKLRPDDEPLAPDTETPAS